MNVSLLPSTYKIRLILERENEAFIAGFCLTQASFEALKTVQKNFLHLQEQIRFANLQYSKRQQTFLLGRYCAKQAISAYTDQSDLASSLIESGIFQQPITLCSTHPNLQVSISHTDTMGAAVAFHEAHPMAIDIEVISADKIDDLQSQMTAAEKALLSSLPGGAAEQLTLLWTAKEALSKVLKCGLMTPFELFEIETLTPQKYFIVSHFKNFKQYQALSFSLGNTMCSLVYPRKTQLNLDVVAMQKTIAT